MGFGTKDMTGLAGARFAGWGGGGNRARRLVCLLAGLCLAAGVVRAQAQTVAAISVPLLRPAGVAFDAAGNLYIAEMNNHVVRRVDTAGGLTTVAGTGVQGFGGDGGAAGSAVLDSPGGVAVDGAGNLYIADTHNQRIRRVAAGTDVILTVAGVGMAGFAGDGGAATAAMLSLPTAVAVDAAGDVFVSDTGNHRVREIVAATGVITTVAGDGVQGFAGDGGAAMAAEIDSPDGLAVDGAGNLYLADTHNQRIRRVAAGTGVIATVAGTGVVGSSGDGGAAAAAALAMPRGVTVDGAGNVTFADTGNHRVRQVTAATGGIATVAGDGVQGFAGDGAAATAASLDSPRGTGLPAGGLVTVADTGNGRVRQVSAGGTLTTVAGLGTVSVAAEMLTITAAPGLVYGSGTVTASLTGTAPEALATGPVVFLDVTQASPVVLGTVELSGNVAVLSTAMLAAGGHQVEATYAGDSAHAAAQSAVLGVTVAPAPVVATAVAASAVYGTAIPPLVGTVAGVLTQDAGNVSVAFQTAAVLGSPAGSYGITAALTGTAAGNYAVTLGAGSGTVTIAKAGTTAGLAAAVSSLTVGTPLTLTAQVASATNGRPQGQVVLMDGGTALQSVLLTPGGVAVFTVSSLAAGTHDLTAMYGGDQNFLASVSPVTVELVGAGGGTGPVGATDFSLTAVGSATQTVAAGNATVFGLSVVEQGTGLPSPVVLNVTGLPLGATASFNPALVVPGALNTAVTLTIQTAQPASARVVWPWGQGVVLAGVVLPWFWLGRGKRRWLAVVLLAGLACAGCGNRVNSGVSTGATTGGGTGGGGGTGTVPATSYAITVTGSGTSASGAVLLHSVALTMVVD
jgi:hypothetical protein